MKDDATERTWSFHSWRDYRPGDFMRWATSEDRTPDQLLTRFTEAEDCCPKEVRMDEWLGFNRMEIRLLLHPTDVHEIVAYRRELEGLRSSSVSAEARAVAVEGRWSKACRDVETPAIKRLAEIAVLTSCTPAKVPLDVLSAAMHDISAFAARVEVAEARATTLEDGNRAAWEAYEGMKRLCEERGVMMRQALAALETKR